MVQVKFLSFNNTLAHTIEEAINQAIKELYEETKGEAVIRDLVVSTNLAKSAHGSYQTTVLIQYNIKFFKDEIPNPDRI